MEADWRSDLETWLTPFVTALRNKTRGRMCPAYIAGLIGPGDRKSVQPMAARDGEVSYDRLHHFIGSGIWDEVPLEMALLAEADRQVGGEDAWLIIDDTALPKKGRHSVGVAPQYASALGKNANCQTLVSTTLASREVPVMVGLRLFLPESWTSDVSRLERAGVPEDLRSYMTKPEIALAEIDKVRAAGVRFGCVLADAGYGFSGPFRQGLSERGLAWAVGIPFKQRVYPADVTMIFPIAGRAVLARMRYPTSSRYRRRRCWRPCHGARSVGGAAPRDSSRPASLRFASQMDHRSVSTIWAPSTCRAKKYGSSANIARPVSANITCPTSRATRRSSSLPAPSRPAGASATQGRARSGPLRGPIMERPASTRADVHDRLRLPSVPPPPAGQRGEKESQDRRCDRACQKSGKPSLTTSQGHQIDHVTTADAGLPTRHNKICQSSASCAFAAYGAHRKLRRRCRRISERRYRVRRHDGNIVPAYRDHARS